MRRPVVADDGPTTEQGALEPAAPARREPPTTRILPGQVDPSKVLGWLCCDPLPPIPLGAKPLLTIGRHHDCDLVLPHKEVSRRHAVVKVRGSAIVFEDEGSSNGSFVNGQRVSHTTLRLGDVVTIGPYEVELKSTDDMAAKDERSETKTNLELTSVSRLSPLAAMTGKLQEVPLAEVLQGIEFNQKTGTLTVSADRQQGVLVVAEGEPQFARWGDLTGDEAVLRMLTLVRGRFAFVGEAEPGERTMRSTLTGLLLEASRRIDEGETAPTDQGAPMIELDEPPPAE
ncbi:MAG: FHA domain-containing protein [Planctomycetes bacterium]|nr:FHA domain-containing protein [Planctomycetota bacterium]